MLKVLLLINATVRLNLVRSFTILSPCRWRYEQIQLLRLKSVEKTDSFPSRVERREKRWKAAVDLLESSIEERRRFDHRAKYARLIGIYVEEDCEKRTRTRNAEILVAMQPDQGGRKLLFLDAVKGQLLGFIELETQSAISNNKIQQTEMDGDIEANSISVPVTSALRGMLVADDCRGKGYARLFLAIWLRLCHRTNVTPATTRINKPLLALTLIRLGFTPLRGHHLATISYENHLRGGVRESVKTKENEKNHNNNNKKGSRKKQRQKKLKEKHRPLAVEVSVGSEGRVLLYSPLSTERLRNGFSATEVRSQRLVVIEEPSEPRGRIAHLRVRYAPPLQMVASSSTTGNHSDRDNEAQVQRSIVDTSSQIVHSPLVEGIGGRLRLTASQGPFDGTHPSALEREETLRQLTGRL